MFKYKKSIVLMLFGSLTFALLFGGKFPYYLFYTVLLAVSISFLWTWVTVRKIHFPDDVERISAYVGDEVNIGLTVQNRSILPIPFVEMECTVISSISGNPLRSRILSMMPYSKKTLEDRVFCRYRGIYPLGPVRVSVSDVFGFFTWHRNVKCSGEILVYPRVVKLQNFSLKPSKSYGTVSTRKKANEDFSSVSDIRRYYPGDSFKKIHWKVSARKGSLHVKNFHMSGSGEVGIFLNMFLSDYDDLYRTELEEKAVECTASIVYYALSKNINTGLFINSSQIIYERGRDLKEFKRFMEGLIKVKSSRATSFTEMVELKSRLLMSGSSIILVTPAIRWDIVDKIVLLKKMGFDVTIIYIMLEDLDEEYNKTIKNCGIRLYKIGIKDDVKTALEG